MLKALVALVLYGACPMDCGGSNPPASTNNFHRGVEQLVARKAHNLEVTAFKSRHR